ncbi:MAG: hypothetical protein IJT08_02360 [Alphaproteobacteria bacterium]|nr:hypothetical protein [Alphaproteobacteria bacterium]
MSSRIDQAVQMLASWRVSLAQRSFFYGLSLDKKSGTFDTSKFIADPWAGDPSVGRGILDGSFDVDIQAIFAEKRWDGATYAASFVWIRDLQALGGHSCRKFARNSISEFINGYRKTKRFWLTPVWNCRAAGERVVNWIFSYSFFASGANDKFQKEILSSMCEHFSHLRKCYRAEPQPYNRLVALKAILFCLSVMKTFQQRQVNRVIAQIYRLAQSCIKDGMFETRSPVDTFHAFRSLLEVRFVAKANGAELPDGFAALLSKMAANIRLLRLGNGELSAHSGSFTPASSPFVPSRHMIDTALSIVDIKDHVASVPDFERLSTKKAVALINIIPRSVRSSFNELSEPGINIFDFEASFGSDKLINRSDISVIFDGLRIKLPKSPQITCQRKLRNSSPFFEGEVHFINKAFEFAMRREIELATDRIQINCTDFVFLSRKFEAVFRFVLGKSVELQKINQHSIQLSNADEKYVFTILSGGVSNVRLFSLDDRLYPTIEVSAISEGCEAIQFDWSIESLTQ